MTLNLKREIQDAVAPVFIKVFELFTGGFAFHSDTVTALEDVELPPGTLLNVDEEDRTAKVIKRGRVAEKIATGATAGYFDKNHFFQVGDYLFMPGGTGGNEITEVEEGDDKDYIAFTTIWADKFEAGTKAYQVASSGATGPGGMSEIANGILRYSATVDDAAGVTVLRRGTVYERRVPPVVDGYDELDTVLFSKSK